MKILLLTLVIATASADDYCTGVFINQKYYNVDIIKEGINRVQELVFNRNDNTVYFTFEQIAKVPTRALAYLKLADNSSGRIKGVKNATGLAIDQNLNILYVGGSDGLFVINLNEKDKFPEKLPVNHDIRSLFFKDNVVYFVNRLGESYTFENGNVSHVYELKGLVVDKFLIDDNNNIIFLQKNEVFRAQLVTGLVFAHDKLFVTDIAVDKNFKLYICAKDGMYVYKKYKYILDKVSELQDIRKLAFTNSDEPIYVVVDNLVRLTNNPVPCFGN